MRQSELSPVPGSRHRRKRIGRGYGSGHGRTSGRGSKGQKARSGGGVRRGFEGGQLPLSKGLPEKRGFVNIFRTEYDVVNVGRLDVFESGAEVTPQSMVEAGLASSLKKPIKVLGAGELNKALTVKANRFSKQARRKIERAGGKTEEVGIAKAGKG